MRSAVLLAICLLAGCATTRTPAPHAVSTSGTAVRVPAGPPGGIRRTLVDRRPATGLPGWETRLYLIEYAPGAAAPLHMHPAVGVGFVLDGVFESAFGDEPIVQVRAGQGFVDQAGVTHRVFRNPSPDHALRFVVAYTLRDGDPPFHLEPDSAGRVDPTSSPSTSSSSGTAQRPSRASLYAVRQAVIEGSTRAHR